jgi:hypothetical protein
MNYTPCKTSYYVKYYVKHNKMRLTTSTIYRYMAACPALIKVLQSNGVDIIIKLFYDADDIVNFDFGQWYRLSPSKKLVEYAMHQIDYAQQGDMFLDTLHRDSFTDTHTHKKHTQGKLFDINAKDPWGQNIFHYAVIYCNDTRSYLALSVLLEFYDDPKSRFDRKIVGQENQYGQVPHKLAELATFESFNVDVKEI